MSADSLWLPRSTCDIYCLPSSDAVPRVGAVRVVGRLATAVAVLAAAGAMLPVIALLSPAGRTGLMRFFARRLLAALGVRHILRGRVPQQGALIVANHVSWLDILVLLAYAPARLLAKHEVRAWPMIGWLAAASGSVFIDRESPRALPRIVADVAGALRSGAVMAVFPEGTTWCGRSSGRFRPALFQAAIDAGVPVAPVTLRFGLGDDTRTTVAAYLGEDTLLASVIRVVITRGLRVTVQAHPALHPVPGVSRRALARVAQAVVQPAGPAPQARPATGTPAGSPAAPVARPAIEDSQDRPESELPVAA
jgi:1-acyl-sn-glycerol-3-phosphate acyltransferase